MSLPATSGAHGAMEKLEHRDAGRTTAVSLHFLTVLLTRPGLSEKKYLPLALILSERKENKRKHQPHHPNYTSIHHQEKVTVLLHLLIASVQGKAIREHLLCFLSPPKIPVCHQTKT